MKSGLPATRSPVSRLTCVVCPAPTRHSLRFYRHWARPLVRRSPVPAENHSARQPCYSSGSTPTLALRRGESPQPQELALRRVSQLTRQFGSNSAALAQRESLFLQNSKGATRCFLDWVTPAETPPTTPRRFPHSGLPPCSSRPSGSSPQVAPANWNGSFGAPRRLSGMRPCGRPRLWRSAAPAQTVGKGRNLVPLRNDFLRARRWMRSRS